MNKKEELLKHFEEEKRSKDHKHILALFLSILFNLIIALFIIFAPKAPRSITFHAKPIPTVFLDEPLPAIRPQVMQNPQPPQPIMQAPAMPQPVTPPLQPKPVPESEAQKKLDYLVKQLISCGNANNGLVALAAGPEPDGESAPPPAEEKKDEQQIAPSTPAEPELSEPVHEEPTHDKQAPLMNEEIQQTTKAPSEKLAEDLTKPTPKDDALAKVISSTPEQPKPVAAKHEKKLNKPLVAQPQQHPSPARPTTPATQKKQLSLADLANSFMKQVHKEKSLSYNYDPSKKNGGGTPGVHSPTNAAANSYELALQMYASKVFTLMQQAAHSLTSLIYAQDDFEANTLLEITIDYKGRLLASRLNPSIAEKDIEAAVQTIIQRVGLFPQIPKHFDTDTITLTFPLNIRGSKGFGKYSLFYGSRA